MTTAFNPAFLAKRLDQLTERQKQVAALASKGHSNKVIARKLNISTGTIKSHLHTSLCQAWRSKQDYVDYCFVESAWI